MLQPVGVIPRETFCLSNVGFKLAGLPEGETSETKIGLGWSVAAAGKAGEVIPITKTTNKTIKRPIPVNFHPGGMSACKTEANGTSRPLSLLFNGFPGSATLIVILL
ncbi:hypothetical protein MICAF_1290001 [Microcystis aeruginosa PCC 9807]|uniref:Uncharacterized protein n=1 Tax=Microcystis aeruginosa PCC 9807 TaxID=1160283 RepID=I4H013_MICAE|nr:hypothetical protein MICAF_1290001 [Microcystis aeruginosa PCC 9807]